MADLTYIAEGLRPLAVPIATLKPDPQNARKHGAANLASIRSSFEKYGQVKPIAARKSDLVVLAGNGRLRVAQEMGWTHIAVVLMEGTPEQLAGFALVDNKSAELADWDEVALSDLMQTVSGAGLDLATLGFQASEIEKLLDAEESLPPVEPPDAPSEPSPAKPPARAADKAKPDAAPKSQRTFAPSADARVVITDEEWKVLHEAATALREDQEDPDMTLGNCLRIIARRYLRGRPGKG